MPLTKLETRDLYRKRARRYDQVILLYPIFGVQINRYRRLMVEALNLHPGNTVVDLACGTGLNFPYLRQVLGESGHIIGVDLTDGMLAQARKRITANGWRNVTLVQEDLAQFAYPPGVDGILSSFAITLVPEYDEVIRRGSEALRTGGRLAVLDFKKPDKWPMWLIRFAVWLNKPYGVSLDLADRHPWESIRRYLRPVVFRDFSFGLAYLAVGEGADRK